VAALLLLRVISLLFSPCVRPSAIELWRMLGRAGLFFLAALTLRLRRWKALSSAAS
jgi:hypothetical protein